MASLTLSDLSQMFQLRRDTVRVRQDLATATQELSSGRRADLGKSVSGNFGPLAAIDRQLSSLDAYDTNTNEATLFFDVAQGALDRVKDASGEFSLRLASLTDTDIVAVGNVIAIEAQAAFDLTVSSLNVTAGGRTIFGGIATDRAAIAAPETILAGVRGAVAGLTTANDVRDAIDLWFTANFDTAVYAGSPDPLAGFQVAEGREVAMRIKGDDPAIRAQLKGLAMAAVMRDSDIVSAGELAKLGNMAGEALIGNRNEMLSLQASVGSVQERVQLARAQNGAERTAFEIARSKIVAVDPYKVATDLQNLQTQLETIYTITARLSGLSLTNYLR